MFYIRMRGRAAIALETGLACVVFIGAACKTNRNGATPPDTSGEGGTGGAVSVGATGTGAGGPGDVCGGCPSGSLCDADLGCRACIGNSDCKDLATSICVLGTCEQCGSTTDCGVNQVCSVIEHTCTFPCKTNADCAGGGAKTCDIARGICVECLTKNDCPNSPICNQKIGQCVDCTADADCGAAAHACDVPTGACVPCLVNPDCDAGFVCVSRSCVKTCSTSVDCGGTQPPVCDVAAGHCVECVKRSDCKAPIPACGPGGVCVECMVDADCPDPNAPACADYQQCIGCVTDDDCKASLGKPHCGPTSDCVECAADTDCAMGQTCSDYQCG